MTFRTPGPLCGFSLDLDWLDPGTLALTRAVPPIPLAPPPDEVVQHALTDEVPIPTDINKGISTPSPSFLTKLLGQPREDYSQECQAVTNKALAALIKTESVGPFKVRGLGPAVDDLRAILAEVLLTQPRVYEKLGTAGMLCCREQRPSKKKGTTASGRVSSHSWGTAIDFTLDGKLDTRGNNTVQYGLTLIAPIFQSYGWTWGAAFRTEDAMHFEVSKERLSKWKEQGLLGEVGEQTASSGILRQGSRGPAVRELQEALKKLGYKLDVDGSFGPRTEAALKEFQKDKNLVRSGVLDPATRAALGLKAP